MGYCIGLKTESEKQAKDIIKFINKNKLNPFNLEWYTGKNLAYIDDDKYVGIAYSLLEDFENTYFFTVIFHLAIKFGITENINGKKYVLINYDDQDTYVLGYENPFEQSNDSRYYSFIKIREDGIKNYREYGMIGKQLGLGLLEKDKSIILDLINTIKNKEVK